LNVNPYKSLRVDPDSGSTLWISGCAPAVAAGAAGADDRPLRDARRHAEAAAARAAVLQGANTSLAREVGALRAELEATKAGLAHAASENERLHHEGTDQELRLVQLREWCAAIALEIAALAGVAAWAGPALWEAPQVQCSHLLCKVHRSYRCKVQRNQWNGVPWHPHHRKQQGIPMHSYENRSQI
jgi:hypothetical protein